MAALKPASQDEREGSAQIGLPEWARELVTLYESGATNQFVLYGNIHDRLVLPIGDSVELGSLDDFLLKVLLPSFQVIITYDLGNGIRVPKGEAIFSRWPSPKNSCPWTLHMPAWAWRLRWRCRA